MRLKAFRFRKKSSTLGKACARQRSIGGLFLFHDKRDVACWHIRGNTLRYKLYRPFLPARPSSASKARLICMQAGVL